MHDDPLIEDEPAPVPGQAQPTRRRFNLSLAIGWGALAATGALGAGMFVDFMAPKALREPPHIVRVGHFDDFTTPGKVYEQAKSSGIWIVNLQPAEAKLIAISTACTHLGCIPNWVAADEKFKCPCHGSGFTMAGVNFEGPAPRPLERLAISRGADASIVVDKSRVFRFELDEWELAGSFVAL